MASTREGATMPNALHDHPHDEHDEDHHRGLAFDVATLVSRRRALGLLAGIGVVALAGCGSGDSSSSASTAATSATTATTAATSSSSTSTDGSSATIPEETAGPFP